MKNESWAYLLLGSSLYAAFFNGRKILLGSNPRTGIHKFNMSDVIKDIEQGFKNKEIAAKYGISLARVSQIAVKHLGYRRPKRTTNIDTEQMLKDAASRSMTYKELAKKYGTTPQNIKNLIMSRDPYITLKVKKDVRTKLGTTKKVQDYAAFIEDAKSGSFSMTQLAFKHKIYPKLALSLLKKVPDALAKVPKSMTKGRPKRKLTSR